MEPPGGVAKAIPVIFAGGTVSAELAATIAQRQTGLMNRATIAPDSGMLFVWVSDQPVGPFSPYFWMKNTSIPLSIAFLDSSRRVLEIQGMAPLDTVTQHRPATPYRYALEVRQGWFTQHGVIAGAQAMFTLPAGLIIDP
jgi:hypothetical protein